jgi:hypothetical protein
MARPQQEGDELLVDAIIKNATEKQIEAVKKAIANGISSDDKAK